MAISPVRHFLRKLCMAPNTQRTEAAVAELPDRARLGKVVQDHFVFKSIPKGSLIGRDHLPDLNLGSTVSRTHAQLDAHGVLTDLGSKRGTFVNGKMVEHPTQLKPSDVVQLGHENNFYQYDGNRLILRNTTIGRNPGHDFMPLLDDSVSRNHARISPSGIISDLQSSSGVFVDGQKISGSRQLKNGNLIALGTKGETYYYYNQGKIHPLTPEKAQLLQRLFPNGLPQSNFKQGYIGNCTLLASIKALLENNPAKLIEMIEPLPNGKVKFSFLGFEKPPFELDLNDFKRQGVEGPLGVQLLETAFGRYLKPKNDICTIQALDEGGYAFKALKAIASGKEAHMVYDFGRPLGQNLNIKNETLARLTQIEKDPANRIAVASAGVNNPEKGLIANHAYSILNANTENQMITLANPHHSEVPLRLTYDEFFRHFRRLTVSNP